MRVKNFRKLFCEWKDRFSEESNLEDFGGPKASFGELEELFKVFHLSSIQLDDKSFNFVPRTPRMPFTDINGSTIEDNFTKRVSLGPSITACRVALQDDAENARFVYAGDIRDYSKDDIKVVPLKLQFRKCQKDLSSTDNKYGYGFNFDDWAEDYLTKHKKALSADEKHEIEHAWAPSQLPKKQQQLFYACVPDAVRTDERWSLNPLRLYYLGKIDGDSEDVYLSEAGLSVVEIVRKLK